MYLGQAWIIIISVFCLDKLWASSFPVEFIGDGLAYHIEDHPLTLEELIKLPPEALKETHNFRPSLGFNSRTFWFQAAIRNTGVQDTALIFEVAYPRFELVDFYVVDTEGKVRAHFLTGTEFPQATRPINHTHFAFPITISAQTSLRVFVKTQTNSPVRFPVKLWEPEKFREYQQNTLLLQGLYFGSLGIMVIYNMFVFFSTLVPAYLFYSLFVSCAGVYLGGEGGFLIRYVFTESAFWNNRILLFAIIGANVSGLMFVTYFMNLKANDPRIHQLIRFMVPAWLLSLLAVFALPYHIVGISYTLISTFSTILLITTTVRGLLRKQREAYFYAAAWITFLFGTVAFALLSLGFIQSNALTEKSIQIGSLFEVTILSLALADRLNQLRIRLKDANENLAYHIEHVEEQVLIKTRDIRSIMEHIPLGVCSIQSDQSIHKDYSKSMESLFHRSHIAGEKALDVLFDKSTLSADQKDQIQAALNHALGEDILNFELNRHFMTEQMVVDWQGQKRTYSLSWNPVCRDDARLEKILVTVHDSTRILTLEREAEAQRQEIAMIQKILDVPTSRFHSFLRQSEHLINECQAVIKSLPEAPSDLHILAMNIHTLKGTARSLYFDEISDLCHMIEDRSKHGNTSELEEDLHTLDRMITRYKRLAIEKLGRSLGLGTTVELKIQEIQGLIKDLTHGTQLHLRTLEMSLYRPFDELLGHNLKAATRLAYDLGKLPPNTIIDAEGFGITQEGYDVLSGLLTHLVRNSLDHGLETAEERQRAGKKPAGCIRVRAFAEQGLCMLDFSDDGRGLDMEKLARKGRELARLPSDPLPQDIAELIFAPELSTRDTVSTVSGRGLGLAAVRETLRREGGDVTIILDKHAQPFRTFHLRLHLPASYCTQFQSIEYAQSA